MASVPIPVGPFLVVPELQRVSYVADKRLHMKLFSEKPLIRAPPIII
jgi:hypothetical protein